MSRTTYKLTINGGTRIGVYRDLERLQVAMLPMLTRLDLFVRNTASPQWVLAFYKGGKIELTEHGEPIDRDKDFAPGWIYPLTQALSRASHNEGPIT